MLRNLILIIWLGCLSFNVFSETTETEKLAKITEDYAKCADVALGNFPSDKEAQAAIKIFYKAMISNLEKVVDLERRTKNESTEFFLDVMGKEVFVGYLLKSFSDVNDQYQDEKNKLRGQLNFDWRQVNERLWSKQGCNAIYVSLSK